MTKAIVEMSKGTRYKYEIDKTTGDLVLDRPVKESVPHNYGFVPQTLCGDGDPIDVFIAAMEPIPPLTEVKIEIVGVIQCIDGGKADPKLLAYIEGDTAARAMINQEVFAEECKLYLSHYKEGLKILYTGSAEDGLKELEKSRGAANSGNGDGSILGKVFRWFPYISNKSNKSCE